MLSERPSLEGSRDLLRWATADLQRRLRAGEPCRVEEYLASHPSLSSDPDKAIALILTELQVRRALGESPSLEEYCERFSPWRELLAKRFSELPTLAPDTVGEAVTRSAVSAPPVPTVSDFRPGEHEIGEEIGRGGMGIVYRAYDAAAQREVALKMIKSGALDGPEVDRFLREARAAARLQHPHTVTIFSVGYHQGQPCYTMTKAEGSLAQCLDRYRGDLRAAVTLMEKVARAVHAAHQEGIIHRDLKPGNILLDKHGEPLVADFGLAKIIDAEADATRTGTAMGTPAYMAPEQVAGDGKTATAATDIWALGVILYEVLTGKRPFQGNNVELPRRIAESEPAPMRSVRPNVPRELEAIVRKCLAKAPKDRYATANALVEDLNHWLQGERVDAAPPSWQQRLTALLGRAGKWRPVAAMLTITLLMGVALTVVGGSGRVPTDGRATRQSENLFAGLLRELKAGRRVTLVGKTGIPPVYRYRTEQDLPPVKPRRGQPLILKSLSVQLLELLPEVPCPSFRYSAQVRFQNTVNGCVGIYYAADQRVTAQGQVEHFFCVYRYADQGKQAGLVQLNFARLVEAGFDNKGEQQFPRLPFPPPPLGEAGKWHDLRLDVHPAEVLVYLDRREICRVPRARQELLVRTWWKGTRRPPPPPSFSPKGGLGLYVERAWAQFADVVVEPLPSR